MKQQTITEEELRIIRQLSLEIQNALNASRYRNTPEVRVALGLTSNLRYTVDGIGTADAIGNTYADFEQFSGYA